MPDENGRNLQALEFHPRDLVDRQAEQALFADLVTPTPRVCSQSATAAVAASPPCFAG